MMADGLTELQMRWLTRALWFLIFVIGASQVYLLIQQTNIQVGQADIRQKQAEFCSSLPDNYVRLERYKEDAIRCNEAWKRIEVKLDRAIERQAR